MAFIHLCKFWVLRTTKQIVLTAYRVVDNPHATCSESPLLEPDTLSFFSHIPHRAQSGGPAPSWPLSFDDTLICYTFPELGRPELSTLFHSDLIQSSRTLGVILGLLALLLNAAPVTSVGSLIIPFALLSTYTHTPPTHTHE